MKPIRLCTIGFTQRTAEQFFTALREARVARVVDVRLNNVSQLAAFSKKDDLAYFLRAILDIDYEHLAQFAPTQEMLDGYKKPAAEDPGGHKRRKTGDWAAYERAFLALMRERRVEEITPRKLLDDACLLCSEFEPAHCHRRLVAEYLKEKWGAVEIVHL